MRYLTSIVIFAITAVGLCAQSREDLEKSFEKAKLELDAIKKEFADSADAALADYLDYEAKLFDEYKAFRNEVMQTWGDSVVVESSRKEWVEYSDDKSSRTTVNWESGKVSVEVLVDPSDDEATVRSKLEKAVENLITSRGSTVGFDSKVLPDSPVSDRPLMEGQLDLSKYGITSVPVKSTTAPKPFGKQSGAPAPSRSSTLNLNRNRSLTNLPGSAPSGSMASKALEKSKAEKVAQTAVPAETGNATETAAFTKEKTIEEVSAAVVASTETVVETVKTTEGVKNVVAITMQLVEDHLPKRAEQFVDIVTKHSDKFSVDAPLILAVMEQESAFNPAAKSWVPAYGLMQLVPKSGGRDAYRYVHKTDKIPTPEFLFDPENNIQLGTGYLKLLMSTSFAKVTDPRSRMLCAIAAYNTGAGNVSRAFTGNTNISKAIPTINSMTYDQLYAHLKANLPHAETQDYIQKVTSKMQKYIK